MQRLAFVILTFVVSTLTVGTGARAAELVYFHSEACSVCERWDEEVGAIYNKTDEAQRLALRTHSVHDDKPADLSFIKGVIFTPTFVVVEDGQEVGRIVGYISDYFFWEQVDGLIKKVDARKTVRISACSETNMPGQPATC